MFRTVPLFIISSFSLYTQQWYNPYSLRAGSGWIRPDPARKLSANLYVYSTLKGFRNVFFFKFRRWTKWKKKGDCVSEGMCMW